MSELMSSMDEDDNFSIYQNGKLPHDLPSKKSDSKPKRKSAVKQSADTDELFNLLHGSNPLKVELNRLENEVRDKDRELADAQAEIKALRLTDRAKEKALEELSDLLEKAEGKLKQAELLLENKNLEMKKINDEKKSALAAQYAAEATLRRVQAAQKDEDLPPIEAILAPLEAELKISRQEVAKLQENNRALDRLTKSKEAALLEAERTVQLAEAKAAMVDDLQNRNQELMKQLEICQEENKILEKMHRQKIAEVEKLSTTVAELEEAVLAGGATANTVREQQQQISQLMEEKKTLERELARAKITANRVAVVVANEWKDANDKVMPVKQWLEERRFMQGEMQQLRDKLSIAERTARTEAQLKEKFQLRLKVLEEGVKGSANGASRRLSSSAGDEVLKSRVYGSSRRQSMGGAEDVSRSLANGNSKRRNSVSQLRGSVSSSLLLKDAKLTKSFDGGRPADGLPSRPADGLPSRPADGLPSRPADGLPSRGKPFSNGYEEHQNRPTSAPCAEGEDLMKENLDTKNSFTEGTNDMVSGVLYDMLQKEVLVLRKASYEKDQSLKDKDDAIEMLSKKVETLTRAMDIEAKKMRREVAIMEKEVAAMRIDRDQESRSRRPNSARGSVNSSQPLTGRASRNA